MSSQVATHRSDGINIIPSELSSPVILEVIAISLSPSFVFFSGKPPFKSPYGGVARGLENLLLLQKDFKLSSIQVAFFM